MYMNVFYIPWFAGLISYIYKPAISSHFKPGLFEMTSLTWLLTDHRNLIYEDLHSSGLMNRDSFELPKVRRFPSFSTFAGSFLPEFVGSYLPEFAGFQLSWNRLKARDPGLIRQSFSTMLENQRFKQNHQNVFTIVSLLRNRFPTTRYIHEYYLRIWQLRRFEGGRFLPNSPTLAPRGRGLTRTIRFHEKSSEFQ
jgi:hypothetical protein